MSKELFGGPVQLFGGPFDGLIIEGHHPDLLVPIENKESLAAKYTYKDSNYIYVGLIDQADLVVEIDKVCEANCQDGQIINPDWSPNLNKNIKKYIPCPKCQAKK